MNNSFTSWVRRTCGYKERQGPVVVGKKWRWLVEKKGAPEVCWWCGVTLTAGGIQPLADTAVTVDHIRPLAEGGADRHWNMKWCCHRCNQVRGEIQSAGSADGKKWILQAYVVAVRPRLLRDGFMRWIS